MGLGYNKIVLYPRRITLAKHISGFIGHKPYTIDKTGKVFLYLIILAAVNESVYLLKFHK